MTTLTLNCFILGDPVDLIFPVEISANKIVGRLRNAIKENLENQHDFQHVEDYNLTLWKVSIPYKYVDEELPKPSEESLGLTTKLSEHFLVQPPKDHVHIIVDPPSLRKSKIMRLENLSPQQLDIKLTLDAMEGAIKPFEEYIDALANGKLDIYLDSIVGCEGKEVHLNSGLPSEPMLLLHGLGMELDSEDQKRVDGLFMPGITHLFSVSGSGKTRLCLEGLCKHWGLYFSCSAQARLPSGSIDIRKAAGKLKTNNAEAARDALNELLCARIFILKKLLQRIPSGTTAAVARRRWVFAQILPPCGFYCDIFSAARDAIKNGVTRTLTSIISGTLNELVETNGNLFSRGQGLFAVVDEAQLAADTLGDYFHSRDNLNLRWILRELINSLDQPGIFCGVILSGVGLSLLNVNQATSSSSAKYIGWSDRVFTGMGRFSKDAPPPQETYINRYLALSEDPLDKRLLGRVEHWLSGRYRFTASFIEPLLREGIVSRHRALTEFVNTTTGFTLTDAADLEDGESPLSWNSLSRIHRYGQVTLLDHLLTLRNVALVRQLRQIVMRWVVGSETTFCTTGQLHESVVVAVGFSARPECGMTYEPSAIDPVYIEEPLVVLHLRTCFEEYNKMTKKGWLAHALADARRNSSSLGFAFEEAVLFIFVEKFGGKATRLSEVFISDQPWGKRWARLVSLHRAVDGNLRICDASWTTGSSDRFGCKAKSPKDVLDFLDDPGRNAFLFPDIHMGPDLICFLQDEETSELIIVAVQCKVAPELNTSEWLAAIQSVDSDKSDAIQTDEPYQHTSISNSTFRADVADAFGNILGEEEHSPVIQAYREKLRSSMGDSLQSNPLATRITPRFIRVIAAPDDAHHSCLKAEHTNDVAVLRWRSVEEYVDKTASMAAPPSFVFS